MVKNKPELVQRFVRASMKGWQTAVDDQKSAVDAVMKYAEAGSTTVDHQTRMMAEVAKLVLPTGMTRDQIGVMDAGRFKTTADIALKFHVINAAADPARSYTNQFVSPKP
jgi:NitT/TauT family transport system substrate-binding protein